MIDRAESPEFNGNDPFSSLPFPSTSLNAPSQYSKNGLTLDGNDPFEGMSLRPANQDFSEMELASGARFRAELTLHPESGRPAGILISEYSPHHRGEIVDQTEYNFSMPAGSLRDAALRMLHPVFEKIASGDPVAGQEALDGLVQMEEVGLIHRAPQGLFDRSQFPDIDFGNVSDRQALIRLLNEFDVPLDQWGTGNAKTLNHLVDELRAGETRLSREGDRLTLTTWVCRVDLYFEAHDGENLHLREDRQIFHDPERIRRRDIEVSVGEKIKTGQGESAREAAPRGIQEELGIDSEIELTGGMFSRHRAEAVCYPGFVHDKLFYTYEATIEPEDFRPEGYVERQRDKDTYFVWERIDGGQPLKYVG